MISIIPLKFSSSCMASDIASSKAQWLFMLNERCELCSEKICKSLLVNYRCMQNLHYFLKFNFSRVALELVTNLQKVQNKN